jgi:hypothetical protein
MTNPIREAFIDRLKSKLYEQLKAYTVFRDYGDTSSLYMIADAIVNNKREEINAYLDQHNFSLVDSGKAIESVLQKILIPEIEKLKI